VSVRAGRSLREIATELMTLGYANKRGKPFLASSIADPVVQLGADIGMPAIYCRTITTFYIPNVGR
jgi:hypothetical protein